MLNPGQSDAVRQKLSALMDGDADAAQAAGACGLWRSNPHARECWHTYHLIGDVLRSDELARPPERDAAFLSSLRSRLADEPVPLAPGRATPAVAVSRWRSRWTAPAAAAAGFVAVAGVLVVTRVAGPSAPAAAVPVAATAGVPDVQVVSGQLVRDARLDRYLSAHRQVSAGAAVHVPGAGVRRVDTIVLENK
jgi:sigma-E factor negative regulatory protein RseA